MIHSRFHEDLASARRILKQARRENSGGTPSSSSREGMRWHRMGGMANLTLWMPIVRSASKPGSPSKSSRSALAEAMEKPFEAAEVTEPQEAPKPRRGDQLVIRRASDIEPQPVKWLWPGRIAVGKVTIVAGEPGLGKSQLTCAIAATVTNAGQWPCDEGQTPAGSVIILSAEDDAADTIRPRLDAAGAAVSKVLIVSAVERAEWQGAKVIQLAGRPIGTRTGDRPSRRRSPVIIDPVSSYLGKVDSHKNAELHAVLEPLGEMAARLGVAWCWQSHTSAKAEAVPPTTASSAQSPSWRQQGPPISWFAILKTANGDCSCRPRTMSARRGVVGPSGLVSKGIGGDIFAPTILGRAL